MSKELLWVSKEIVEQVKELDGSVEDMQQIRKIFDKFKREISDSEYQIDDTVSDLRRQVKKIKDALQETFDKETQELYEFWEQLEDRRGEIQKQIHSATKLIQATKTDIQALKEDISSLNLYGIDRLIDMVEKINNMNDRDKDLLAKLFNHNPKIEV